jgi:MFS family permease
MQLSSSKTLTLRQLILPLYLPTFLLSIAQSTMIPILPLFADSFQVGYSWIGIALAGEGIGMLLGDLPAGMSLRKLGARKTMLSGVMVWGICTLLLYWANHIVWVFALQVIGGFGFSFYGVSRLLMISEKLPSSLRGQAVALIGGVFRMGRVVGPIAAGLLAVHFQLRSGFIFFFLVVILSFLVLRLFMPEIYPESNPSMKNPIGTMLKGHTSILLRGGSGQFILSLLRNGPRVIIPLYGANVLGLGVEQIGGILSIAALLDMALFLPAGWIMDNFGRKFSVIPSVAFLGVSLLLIPFTSSYSGLLLVALIGGAGNGISAGLIMTMGADFAPPAYRGEFLGVWRFIGDSGSTTSPLILGALADLISLQQTSFVMSGFSVVGVFLFALMVPETLRNPIWHRRR